MYKRLLLVLCVSCFRCQNNASNDANSQIDSLNVQDSARTFYAHLKDTSIVQGDCVVLIRPDSIRFESYKEEEEEEGVYEADSDFGFWLTAAIDSMKKNKSLRNVTSHVIVDRFIKVKNCSDCPQIIDRDTIEDGILLKSKMKRFQINSGLGGGNYIEVIRDYCK